MNRPLAPIHLDAPAQLAAHGTHDTAAFARGVPSTHHTAALALGVHSTRNSDTSATGYLRTRRTGMAATGFVHANAQSTWCGYESRCHDSIERNRMVQA